MLLSNKLDAFSASLGKWKISILFYEEDTDLWWWSIAVLIINGPAFQSSLESLQISSSKNNYFGKHLLSSNWQGWQFQATIILNELENIWAMRLHNINQNEQIF